MDVGYNVIEHTLYSCEEVGKVDEVEGWEVVEEVDMVEEVDKVDLLVHDRWEVQIFCQLSSRLNSSVRISVSLWNIICDAMLITI